MRLRSITVLLFVVASSLCRAQSSPLLLQRPTLSRTQIVFSYAGDLWSVARTGGAAARLTTGIGIETDPVFSPDGSTIAFTGEYDGNTDVYVMPATGGIPTRLTWHPAPDVVRGWTPDGKRVLYWSARGVSNPLPRLFTIAKDGGEAEMLPLPSGTEGSFDATASHIAYVPKIQNEPAWKRYRGGQTLPIWIADLATSKVEKVPRNNTNDSSPMWIGNQVYFLSDREGPITLFSYDTATKRVRQVLKNTGLDIKYASAGPGAIVYEQFGAIHLFDPATGKEQPVAITVAADMPEVRRRYENVAGQIANAGISPTGARAVFEARGEILTVPADKGSIRNLTNTPGAMERNPAWSPDGKSIAYFSDEGGDYALNIRDQNGTGKVRKIDLGSPPSFFYDPVWSPDSKKIAYTDKRTNFWYVDLDRAYTHDLKNHLGAAFVYRLDEGKPHQVTDGLSDVQHVDFDRGGKYLYFTASTDTGPASGWLDMSSINHPGSRAVYVMVLRKDLPSPLAPESDEEKVAEAPKADTAPPAPKPIPGTPAATTPPAAAAAAPPPAKPDNRVNIDFDNISQRILALPIPRHNYVQLTAGKAGTIFLLLGPEVERGLRPEAGGVLQKFDLGTRKADAVGAGITGFQISGNGEKILYSQGPRWAIASTMGPLPPGAGTLNTAGMEVMVDPAAEWSQMYREVWRIERDFFYDPGLHGVNLAATQKKYAAYLPGIAGRSDLNYLFQEMLGELSVGHQFVAGGQIPQAKPVAVGLLGADYKVENGRYRFARVFNGENWNPTMRAPLTQPGVNIVAGEYLLAVNGKDVLPGGEIYRYFESTAGTQITLKVGPNADGSGSREVIVTPIESEYPLRNLAWVEDNRRKVDQLSGGRVAYVYLPDTGAGGYTFFNRYYFAQVGREGAVIDERFNGGGLMADYIIDYMRRPLMGFMSQREGADYSIPVGSIYGAKAMIINEYAGSGGDALPWMFRHANVGPIVGKRTWGGLVGIFGFPPLMDGGFVTAPNTAFWNPNGTWDVENHGVDPDIDVEMDPEAVRAGHDPQLEKAVQVVLDDLKKHPLPTYKKPAFPNYHPDGK